jgi:hypothetical protein
MADLNILLKHRKEMFDRVGSKSHPFSTQARKLIQNKFNTNEEKVILGNSDIKTTIRYANLGSVSISEEPKTFLYQTV